MKDPDIYSQHKRDEFLEYAFNAVGLMVHAINRGYDMEYKLKIKGMDDKVWEIILNPTGEAWSPD